MRKFNINVNGKAYAVEVEEIGGSATTSMPVQAQAAAPVATPAAPAAKPVGNGKQIVAPMPGLVKKLCFANGATVKEGDTIIILEAMKMDTPVVANASGVITYSTDAGANVDTGAVLCTIA